MTDYLSKPISIPYGAFELNAATPNPPPVGFGLLRIRPDKSAYIMDSDGVEVVVGGSLPQPLSATDSPTFHSLTLSSTIRLDNLDGLIGGVGGFLTNNTSDMIAFLAKLGLASNNGVVYGNGTKLQVNDPSFVFDHSATVLSSGSDNEIALTIACRSTQGDTYPVFAVNGTSGANDYKFTIDKAGNTQSSSFNDINGKFGLKYDGLHFWNGLNLFFGPSAGNDDATIERVSSALLKLGDGGSGYSSLRLNQITRYNGVALTNNGIPSQVGSVNLTAQTTSIGTANLYASAPAGIYKINYYLLATTSGAAGTVTVTFTWNDGKATQTITSATVMLTAVTAGHYTNGSIFILSGSAQNITYATTVTGVVDSADYALYATVEAL